MGSMARSLGEAELEGLLEAFRRTTPAERARLQAGCTPQERNALAGYAFRCADRALREPSRELIADGLVALALEAGLPDWRDTTIQRIEIMGFHVAEGPTYRQHA